jgi:hypothetical protein
MRHRAPEISNDVTVYLALSDHGQFGIAYDGTDPARVDRETLIRNFLSGQYSNALRVIAFTTVEGWSRDGSEDIADEVSISLDADDNLGKKIPSGSSTGISRPARSGRRQTRLLMLVDAI